MINIVYKILSSVGLPVFLSVWLLV